MSASKPQYHPSRWVPTLYFAEGLPFVAVNIVSVLMYKSMGISDGEIALFTSLALFPWTLKPLWGPFLEMFRSKKYFVVATQFIGGASFGLLALTLPLDGFFLYSLIFLVLIAFNGATHDIAADGVYVNVLSLKDQARYVGWQGAFYNVAKVFAQGALVFLAGQLETTIGVKPAWMAVMAIFGLILAGLAVYHLRVLPVGGAVATVEGPRQAFETFVSVVRSFFRKEFILWGIVFIIVYRFAEGQAMKIIPLFLKAGREAGGLGLDTSEIGVLYGVFPPASFILGSLIAGYVVARRGLKRSLLMLCAFFNIPFAVYAYLASATPESLIVIGSAVAVEFFGYGFGFVGLTLYMMQQIAPGPFKMAHYAIATGVMNAGLMIPSALSGFISDLLGYRDFFFWVMVSTIPSFLVAWLVPFRRTEEEVEPRG